MGQDMRELLSEVAGTSISGRDRVPRYRHSLNPATGLSAQAPASAGCRVATLCLGPLETLRNVRDPFAIGGIADSFCSLRGFPPVTRSGRRRFYDSCAFS